MNLRFPHIFAFLMLASLLATLAIPAAASNRICNSFAALFAPIAGPLHWLGGSARPQVTFVEDAPVLTGISDEQQRLRQENRLLREQLARLTGQLDALRSKVAEREWLGTDLANRSVDLKVIGRADGNRQVLKLSGTERPLSGGEVVIYHLQESKGLVGVVAEGVGAGNQASVRLITDADFNLSANAGRIVASGDPARGGSMEFVQLNDKQHPLLIVGNGRNELRVANLTMQDAREMKLKIGDLIVYTDPTGAGYADAVGWRIGTISEFKENRLQPLFAEIRIDPGVELISLREVTVIVK